jgi:hypothetical protein
VVASSEVMPNHSINRPWFAQVMGQSGAVGGLDFALAFGTSFSAGVARFFLGLVSSFTASSAGLDLVDLTLFGFVSTGSAGLAAS